VENAVTRDAGTVELLEAAVASLDAGRPADAHALAIEALGASAGDDSRRVEALLVLGRASTALSAHDDAEEAFDEAIALAEELDGDAAATLQVLALAGRAGLARTLGRYEEAEEQYRRALAQAGPDTLEEATVANDLAVTLKFSGKLDEPEELYLRALAIVERELGSEHPDVAAILHNLGGLAHARGDHAGAEAPSRRSVELRRRACGDDHPEVAADLAALAPILHGLGRDDEAEALLRQAIDVFERSFGPAHYEVAFNQGQLAGLVFRRGRLDEAEALYRRALAQLEGLLGLDHPDLCPPLNNLAVLLAERGDPDAAAALYRRALAILARSVEPDHPTLVACRENLADLVATRS
jgi:tetratricopeptide (TPR) repeat protein